MTSYGRALSLVTLSSLTVPVIGLASAPLLAQALGPAGRGAVSAALAPHLLIVGGATIGLPQAVTFYVAKRPRLARPALMVGSALSLPLAIVALAIVWVFNDFLSGSDATLGRLMIFGVIVAIPALAVGLLRGAAMAHEMWRAVALEKILASVLRLLALIVLLLTGTMSVATAVAAIALTPVVAGVVYVRLFRSAREATTPWRELPGLGRNLVTFGAQVWLGSVAFVLLARSTDLLMTPLSGTVELGIFVVAVTIADIPYILSQAVYGVLFSTSSASMDTARIGKTSRCCLVLSVLGAAVLGVTLPLWIGFAFGTEFEASILPTWLLLAASCVAVPGILAGAGIDAAGRPGLRSLALAGSVIVNVVLLVALVPTLGAVGAACAGLVATTFSSVTIVVLAARTLGVSKVSLTVPARQDVVDLATLAVRGARRLAPGGKSPRS